MIQKSNSGRTGDKKMQKRKNRWYIAVAAVVILAVVLVLAVVLGKKGKNKKDPKMIEPTQQEQASESGEVDVTKALMNLAQRGELIGVDVDGESYDVGLPEMYYRTFVEYRR